MSAAVSSQSALIVGATSMLGRELAQSYAASGWRVILAARDSEEVRSIASDLTIRNRVTIDTIALDLADAATIDEAAADIVRNGLPRVIVIVAGAFTGAADAPSDARIADNLLAVNYSGPARLVGDLLPALQAAPGSAVAFVSSVAGDRGRKKNFVYGAAKAALNAYAQGLRALLAPHDVTVLTVKLGFMDTRMAYGASPPALTCSPRYAARAIRRAIERRRMVVYVPWFWRWIMAVLRTIPERIFIRLPIP